ncbi:MAG TPA: DNA repair protein RecO [Burkholderiales bacterium]|nr:DNA repair protein RecO [Burkholderiales bacterium]
MTRRKTEQEPAFVLHTYPYKESSLIVEVFSRHAGRIALLARGARRARSAIRGTLLSFHPLRLGWTGVAELPTLTAAEWSGGYRALAGIGLMCGFYLNELLLRLLPREDPHEALFDAYGETLALLGGAGEQAPLLRRFELSLLRELGYAPPLDREAGSDAPVTAARHYAYASETGPRMIEAEAGAAAGEEVVVSGQTLLDMAQGDFSRPQTREESRRLMRRLIAERLAGKDLYTRDVLRELQDL